MASDRKKRYVCHKKHTGKKSVLNIISPIFLQGFISTKLFYLYFSLSPLFACITRSQAEVFTGTGVYTRESARLNKHNPSMLKQSINKYKCCCNAAIEKLRAQKYALITDTLPNYSCAQVTFYLD
jgi:hypothetical protein